MDGRGSLSKVLNHTPSAVKYIGKRLHAETLINWLFYPTTRQYTIGSSQVTFSFPSHGEYSEVNHDVTSERELIKDMVRSVRPDDTVFDVGANVGTHTCFLADGLSSGRVHAFEPLPSNVARLRANVELNRSNVVIEPYAFGGDDDPMQLAVGTAGKEAHLADDGASHSIRVVTGDTMVKSGVLPVPSVMKIDVEGAELDVLKGFRGTLTDSGCRLVYCEVHPRGAVANGLDEAQREELERLLTDSGFELSYPVGSPGSSEPYHVKATSA